MARDGEAADRPGRDLLRQAHRRGHLDGDRPDRPGGRARPAAGRPGRRACARWRSSTTGTYGTCDVCGQADPARAGSRRCRGPCSASRTPASADPMTLLDRLPTPADAPDPDALFDVFETWVGEQGLTLYPAQEEALIEIVSGANVILSTPTGTGKSLVATGAHFAALARGERTFYTAPIKALVSEKFFALIDVFGAENVGMLTGDAAVNAQAPIVCCTAEVLANIALREGADADVGQVVMDEFHFYAEPDRGWAWQVPLLELPQAQFLLMSATLGDVTRFVDDLTRRTGRETAVVTSATRPVPLSYEWAVTPMHETHRGAAHHPPGAGLRRALHPGRRARTGAGADQHQRLHPRGEGPDRRADRRLPVQPRLREDPVAAGEARHRRAPRRDAAEVPPPRRAARPGRAAQGHLRHRHPRRRHQRADPHGGVHRPLASTTGAGSGCSRPGSSTRSPGGRGGPASTPPAPSSCRRPSTSSRTPGW